MEDPGPGVAAGTGRKEVRTPHLVCISVGGSRPLVTDCMPGAVGSVHSLGFNQRSIPSTVIDSNILISSALVGVRGSE